MSAGAISSLAASAFAFDGNTMDDTTLGWANSVRSSGAGMIAFGTISGGAGAALTGGNFWQGAVTGLIVSGLNHGLHVHKQKSEFKEDVRQSLKENGYSLDDYAKLTFSELVNFAEKILPKLYAEAGKPIIDINPHTDDNGYIAADESTNFTTKVNKIWLGKTAFESYFKLATIIGHELNHVIDNNNGNYTKWFNLGGKLYRKAMAENNAYNWQLSSNGYYSKVDNYWHYAYIVNYFYKY